MGSTMLGCSHPLVEGKSGRDICEDEILEQNRQLTGGVA